MGRIGRAAFGPAVAELRVLDEAVAVGVGGGGEAPGLDDRIPARAQEIAVAGMPEVVGLEDDVEGRRVRGVPRVLVLGEPGGGPGALPELVRAIPVVCLQLAPYVQRGAGGAH